MLGVRMRGQVYRLRLRLRRPPPHRPRRPPQQEWATERQRGEEAEGELRRRQTHHQLPEGDLHNTLEPDRIVLPREVVLHVNGEEKGLEWVNVSLAVV